MQGMGALGLSSFLESLVSPGLFQVHQVYKADKVAYFSEAYETPLASSSCTMRGRLDPCLHQLACEMHVQLASFSAVVRWIDKLGQEPTPPLYSPGSLLQIFQTRPCALDSALSSK